MTSTSAFSFQTNNEGIHSIWLNVSYVNSVLLLSSSVILRRIILLGPGFSPVKCGGLIKYLGIYLPKETKHVLIIEIKLTYWQMLLYFYMISKIYSYKQCCTIILPKVLFYLKKNHKILFLGQIIKIFAFHYNYW